MSKPPDSIQGYLGVAKHTPLHGKTPMSISPEELEFFAEQEEIMVVPNFSLDTPGSKLHCIGGSYGPFKPNMPAKVPIWLALLLYRRKKCTIQPPQWMDKQELKKLLQDERTMERWQRIPEYYLEISCLLRRNAAEIFGSDEEQVEVFSLIDSIKDKRFEKMHSGLKKLSQAQNVKLTNLSATECNMIRLLFKGAMDTFEQLEKAHRAVNESHLTQTQQGGSFSFS